MGAAVSTTERVPSQESYEAAKAAGASDGQIREYCARWGLPVPREAASQTPSFGLPPELLGEIESFQDTLDPAQRAFVDDAAGRLRAGTMDEQLLADFVGCEVSARAMGTTGVARDLKDAAREGGPRKVIDAFSTRWYTGSEEFPHPCTKSLDLTEEKCPAEAAAKAEALVVSLLERRVRLTADEKAGAQRGTTGVVFGPNRAWNSPKIDPVVLGRRCSTSVLGTSSSRRRPLGASRRAPRTR